MKIHVTLDVVSCKKCPLRVEDYQAPTVCVHPEGGGYLILNEKIEHTFPKECPARRNK